MRLTSRLINADFVRRVVFYFHLEAIFMTVFAALSTATVYSNVKDIISFVTGLPRSKIRQSDNLRNKYRMAEGAVRGLAKHINDRFKSQGISVTTSECAACQTVRDIVNLIVKKKN